MISFNQKDVETFAEVTGDKNPIHLNEKFASNTKFGRPIIHGFLSTSIFSKIFGMDFPGEGTIYLEQNLKFLKPMYVKNEYRTQCTITKIDKEKSFVYFDTIIKEEKTGKQTIIGSALLLVEKNRL